jgi:hypothetical protein
VQGDFQTPPPSPCRRRSPSACATRDPRPRARVQRLHDSANGRIRCREQTARGCSARASAPIAARPIRSASR